MMKQGLGAKLFAVADDRFECSPEEILYPEAMAAP